MDLHTALLTVVAVMALLTGLGFIFNLLLGPLKRNQDRFDVELKEIKAKLDKVLEKIKA